MSICLRMLSHSSAVLSAEDVRRSIKGLRVNVGVAVVVVHET
jgi:hypothetical protein